MAILERVVLDTGHFGVCPGCEADMNRRLPFMCMPCWRALSPETQRHIYGGKSPVARTLRVLDAVGRLGVSS